MAYLMLLRLNFRLCDRVMTIADFKNFKLTHPLRYMYELIQNNANEAPKSDVALCGPMCIKALEAESSFKIFLANLRKG